MDKMSKYGAAIIISFAIIVLIAGFSSYFIGRASTGNTDRAGSYKQRERALLDRIGEFEQREREYLERERARTEAEDQRIKRERARVERTAEQLAAIRQLDRRSGDLYKELATEIDLLENYFRSSCHELGDDVDNLGDK